MTIAASESITLEEFLKLPETEPGEYIDGEIIRPMPKGRQPTRANFLSLSGHRGSADYTPFLSCSGLWRQSIVPDIAVFQWNHIPFTADGEVPDDFERHQIGLSRFSLQSKKPNQVWHPSLSTPRMSIRMVHRSR